MKREQELKDNIKLLDKMNAVRQKMK